MEKMPRDLPEGTVTFLFTDIEGSTALLRELGAEAYETALTEHRGKLREAFASHGGVEVDTQGDAFFFVFSEADAAAAAAAAAQAGLAGGAIRVRMGLHTGAAHRGEGGYVGENVHLGARIAASGHGGQVLLSRSTRGLIEKQVADLGEHRLKDFDEPIWIYQLGSDRFPPLKTISNTNLPRPASSFVGREQEVTDVVEHLRAGTRLLTLTGPGGSGKTRLGIEAATDLIPEFRNGTFWIALAPVRDPALVSETISQVIGAKDRLADHIGERHMLLLVDNLEQVIEAANGLADLVETCPNLSVLVTSREVLRVRGEVEYPVLPLAERDAVELFCIRSDLDPDPTIAELCRRLDNLPLAVELAVARTSVLTPAEILARLSQRLDLLKGGRDAEVRQQTLRSTIAWSHDLLTEGDQLLFARLAVFAGGCPLETAIAVADADLDVLQSLVAKSLVRHTNGRFWMLETIREFATERLDGGGEADAIRDHHADFYVELAVEFERQLMAGPADLWFARLELELDNIRAALDYLEGSHDAQRALRLAGSLADFWSERAHHTEALARLRRLLAADGRPTVDRAKALNAVSQLASTTGEIDGGLRASKEALTLARSLGDRLQEAIALWSIGYLQVEGGAPDQGVAHLSEALGILAKIGKPGPLMWVKRTLGFAYIRLGDYERARPLYEEVLSLARAAGDASLEAGALGGLCDIAMHDGRTADAAAHASAGLEAVVDSRDWLMQTSRISVAAEVIVALGRASEAAELLGYAEAQHEELGAMEHWVEEMNARSLAKVRTQLNEPSLAEAWARGRKLTTDAAIALALDVLNPAITPTPSGE
jgi:predicted ATPase/class 3 adenylate cyclase